MQHCPARAAQRLAAAVLALCLVLALAVPHAHAAALQETHGIRMLDFSTSQILSIGNQTAPFDHMPLPEETFPSRMVRA